MESVTMQHMEEVYYNIGNLLSTSREIIQKIFHFLGYKDLVSATQVCEYWSLIGHQILEKRRLKFITLHPNGVLNTDLQIVNDLPTNSKSLENFLESINFKSFHCLGFTCGGWLGRGDIITKFSPNGSTLSNLMKYVFPKNCEMAFLEASGVVGSEQISTGEAINKRKVENSANIADDYWTISNSFNQVGYSIELEETPAIEDLNEDTFMLAASLIVFPEQPGVKFNLFTLDEDHFYKTYRNTTPGLQRRVEVSQEEFNSICGLKPEDDLKGLLIFTYTLRSLTRSFLDAAQLRQNDKVALGGGLVDWVQRSGDYFKGTIGISICGRNVQTASVVIPSSIRDARNLKIRLGKLKEKGLPEGHSFCFMFSCCGRGSCWYKKSHLSDNKDCLNVESRAFRELFPHTPVFGFFGDGEIGNNFYSRDEEDGCFATYDGRGGVGGANSQFLPRKRKKRKQNLFHQFSTIFVLVSIL